MSYCTVEELRVATGTNYPDVSIHAPVKGATAKTTRIIHPTHS